MARGVVREMLAEFFGTFVLIVFGVAVVAQTVLSKNSAGSPLGINIGWGLAVTMACYVSAGVTGAGSYGKRWAVRFHDGDWKRITAYAARPGGTPANRSTTTTSVPPGAAPTSWWS